MSNQLSTQPKLRSQFYKINLGGSVHRTKKGKGSYQRKDRNNNRYGN